MTTGQVLIGDCREHLARLSDGSVDCVITSPPYFLQRDYSHEGQIGLENTVQEYLETLCSVFDSCYRVLKSTGTLFVVIGDTYSTASGRAQMIAKGMSFSETAYSSKCTIRDVPVYRKHVYLSGSDPKPLPPKTALLIPERFAIEMVSRGWILRSKIIWEKPNAIPESVTDRFSVNFENIYFFVKSKKYFFNLQFEPSAQNKWDSRIAGSRGTLGNPNSRSRSSKSSYVFGNKRRVRSVWRANTANDRNSCHTARFPESIVERCFRAGCPKNGIVLDPFAGSGTTGKVAKRMCLSFILIELNEEFLDQNWMRQSVLSAFATENGGGEQ